MISLNVTCSSHDITGQLLSWRYAIITHSPTLNKHVQYINKIAYEDHSKYKRDVIMKRLKKSNLRYNIFNGF